MARSFPEVRTGSPFYFRCAVLRCGSLSEHSADTCRVRSTRRRDLANHVAQRGDLQRKSI